MKQIAEAFKKAKPIKNEHEKKAKMGVLEDLKRAMSDHQGEGLKKIKKVSVVSDSQEGLEKGLKKAEDIVGEHSMSDMVAEGEEVPEESEESAEAESPIGEKSQSLKDMMASMDDSQLEELMKAIEDKKRTSGRFNKMD